MQLMDHGCREYSLQNYTSMVSLQTIDVTIVRFHRSVVEVEDEAFRDCNNLREVVLHDGLQKIGYAAFCKCTSLSSIILPSTVIEIGGYSFAGCKNLRETVLNDGLQKIGQHAFNSCTSLSSVTLPSTVTEIENRVFEKCNNLTGGYIS